MRVRRSTGVRKAASRVLWYVLLTALAVVTLFPFLWMLSTSLKLRGSVFGFPPQIIPWPMSLANYVGVWQTMPLPQFVLNSLYITVAGVGLNLVFSSMAGYALARMEFPGRNLIFYLILSTLMLPSHVGLIVNFVTMLRLHLVDTLAAVYLPSAVTVFGIFLMRQSYLTIPRELEDAAVIDGAGDVTIWLRLMTPLVKPGLATLALFEFVGMWNGFLWPLVVLKTPEKFPLAVGLLYLQGLFAHNTRYIAAGAVIMTVPTVALFLLMQRSFIRGMTMGALK